MKLIWLGVGFLNKTDAEIGYQFYKKCNKIICIIEKIKKYLKCPALWLPLAAAEGPVPVRARRRGDHSGGHLPPPPRDWAQGQEEKEEGKVWQQDRDRDLIVLHFISLIEK